MFNQQFFVVPTDGSLEAAHVFEAGNIPPGAVLKNATIISTTARSPIKVPNAQPVSMDILGAWLKNIPLCGGSYDVQTRGFVPCPALGVNVRIPIEEVDSPGAQAILRIADGVWACFGKYDDMDVHLYGQHRVPHFRPLPMPAYPNKLAEITVSNPDEVETAREAVERAKGRSLSPV